MSSPRALPGFRDFYPEDLALRAHLFATWRRVAARYGFEEYDGPPLEPLELYTAKSGEEIVGQLYEFTDKGERRVALRPEMTPTLARMVGARAKGLKKPIRWFSLPQLFRYERQQRGRLREHFQLNCDLIGEAGPLADAEIIALAIDVLRAFELDENDFRVRVSDRRIIEALLASLRLPPEAHGKVYRALDISRKAAEQARAILAEAMATPVMPEALARLATPKPFSRAELLELLGDQQVPPETSAPLFAVLQALEDMGLGAFLEVDLSIVRGLAYYTGTVFELFDAKGELRAICGGGRYDDLVGALGGVDLPCVGFGMGDVVLGELLKDRGLVPAHAAAVDAFVVGIDGADVPHVLHLAHALRDAGLRAEYALTAQPIAKQLRQADSRGARFAVVMGADERARGEVMLKDFAAKTQRPVLEAEVAGEIRRALAAAGAPQ